MENLILTEIPDDPKIPLENYLLDLVDKKDGVGNSLYLYKVGNFISSLWKDILDKNKTIGVRTLLPEVLNLEPTHLYKIMKNKRGISIQAFRQFLYLWEKYCSKKHNDAENLWNEVYNNKFPIASFSKPIKTNLPLYISPKLSYLIGWFVGDGCFDSSGNHQRLKISEKNSHQLELIIKPLVEDIFDVNCLIRKDHYRYCARIFSKPVFRFFRNVLNVKVGFIPEIVNKMDIVNKQYFIRGLFDAEGYVNANYKGSRIRIFQASKSFLNQTIRIFRDIGIYPNGPYGPFFKYPTEDWPVFSKWYYIEIRKKSDILKFAEKIGSSHLNKLSKLKHLSEEINKRYKYLPH